MLWPEALFSVSLCLVRKNRKDSKERHMWEERRGMLDRPEAGGQLGALLLNATENFSLAYIIRDCNHRGLCPTH